ncbi:MAG: DUF3373 family protein [Campylobacterales bacterium]|nr:DUF3373 family protein [Campylobacterales bacterium]
MKKIALSILATTFIFANTQVEDRLNQMENQIKQLQEMNKKLLDKVSKQDSSEAVEELEGRIDEIETMALRDKISFTLGFKTDVNNFSGDLVNGESFSDENIWHTKLMLNMFSSITDDMKFTGRLSMNKFWADSAPIANSYIDPMQGIKPSDSSVWVERAYIDWILNNGSLIPVTLTIGRQPSSDGPSFEFRENTTRKATYSALSFDGAADGVVATVNLSKVTLPNTAVRIAYGKGYQDHANDKYIGDSAEILADNNIYGLFVDSAIPAVKDNLIQFYVVSGGDLKANVADGIDNQNPSLGDLMLYGAMLQFTNINDSGFDFFAQYARNEFSPNGKAYMMNGIPYTLVGNNPADLSDKSGHALWSGFRYTLPMYNNPKFGYEYNKGSKNWFSMTMGSDDLINKLATRGDAHEIYFIQPINKFAYLRAGAVFQDFDYAGSMYHIGTPMELNKNNPMVAKEVDKLTDYYLMFNVLY